MRSERETAGRARGRGSRRAWLAALALGAMAAPQATSGCAASFDPPSKVNALRVFAVAADTPYAKPGDAITFEMTYYDGLIDPETGEASPRPVQILWLGGCFNPEGDQYYACYQQLAEVLGGLQPDAVPSSEYLAAGIGLDTFTLTLPDDIVSSRPTPSYGPHYGIAYVFFAACAGRLGPVTDEGSGRAGSFPIGCFDTATGARLGTESFVPGFTQVYAFADGRENPNPPVDGLTLDGVAIEDDLAKAPATARCALTEDERRVQGCGQEDPYAACTTYNLKVIVDQSVADIDPDATDTSGKALREVVWVDYYADGGDIDSDVKLVSDASKGLLEDFETRWVPPAEPSLVTVWAVLHDARGGSSVVQRYVRVE